MTPTHKPEYGDRAPISNGGAERTSLPKSVACLWVTDNPKHCSLLRPAPNVVNAFPWPADSKTEEDRNYWRERGFWQEPLFTAEQMYDYANTDATALLAEKAQRIERLEAALAAAELALFHGANMLNAICETEETVDRRRAAEKLVDATKAARVALLEETTGEKM